MTDRFDDWLPVIPAPGTLKQVAKELLALAEDPSLVRTDGNGTEFLVPAALARQYLNNPEPVAAPKPRRSRAKKNEEAA
jgi:hypothetical protein